MLEELRKEIDAYDREIIDLLKKRLEVVKKIGEYKKNNNLNIYDQQREKNLIEKLKGFSSENLTKEMIENIYGEIISSSRDLQKKIH